MSFVTELESQAYKGISAKELNIIKQALGDSTVIDINTDIKRDVIAIRKQHNLKLPDAIIAATALYLNMRLMTSDKQFANVKGLDVLLYDV